MDYTDMIGLSEKTRTAVYSLQYKCQLNRGELMRIFNRIIKVLLSCSLVLSIPAFANDLTGAGSTFIYPVMSKWAQAYAKEFKYQVNYQPTGSSGGLRLIRQNTVDFAASDIPLNSAQLKKDKLVQFPMIIGGIVPVVHIQGIGNNQLTLSGDVLAKIYLNQITKWNDPQIQALNTGVTLPSATIIVVHRSDGSGTTFNFTNYLSKVNQDWAKKIGANAMIAWPGFSIGAKGNAGVASQVMQMPNSIGYVEYAYAHSNHLTTTKMINQAGKTVTADASSFAAAAKNAKWNQVKHFDLVLTNQPGTQSWPIVATTFALLPQKADDHLAHELAYLKWCYVHGQAIAKSLDYVPIPAAVYQRVFNTWQQAFGTVKTANA